MAISPFTDDVFALASARLYNEIARNDPQPFKQRLAAVAYEWACHRFGASSAMPGTYAIPAVDELEVLSGRRAFAHIVRLDVIELIADQMPEPELRDALAAAEVEIVIAAGVISAVRYRGECETCQPRRARRPQPGAAAR